MVLRRSAVKPEDRGLWPTSVRAVKRSALASSSRARSPWSSSPARRRRPRLARVSLLRTQGRHLPHRHGDPHLRAGTPGNGSGNNVLPVAQHHRSCGASRRAGTARGRRPGRSRLSRRLRAAGHPGPARSPPGRRTRHGFRSPRALPRCPHPQRARRPRLTAEGADVAAGRGKGAAPHRRARVASSPLGASPPRRDARPPVEPRPGASPFPGEQATRPVDPDADESRTGPSRPARRPPGSAAKPGSALAGHRTLLRNTTNLVYLCPRHHIDVTAGAW